MLPKIQTLAWCLPRKECTRYRPRKPEIRGIYQVQKGFGGEGGLQECGDGNEAIHSLTISYWLGLCTRKVTSTLGGVIPSVQTQLFSYLLFEHFISRAHYIYVCSNQHEKQNICCTEESITNKKKKNCHFWLPWQHHRETPLITRLAKPS